MLPEPPPCPGCGTRWVFQSIPGIKPYWRDRAAAVPVDYWSLTHKPDSNCPYKAAE